MKAHRTDVLSLVFGLLFLTVAAGFAAQDLLDIELPDIGWFFAGGGVLIGLAIAITALVPSRKEEVTQAQPNDAEQA
jgi:hypothetical protein